MKERTKKVLETIKRYHKNGIDLDEAVEMEFKALSEKDQEKVGSLYGSYLAKETWELAQKDKKVAERVTKAIEIIKKEGKWREGQKNKSMKEKINK